MDRELAGVAHEEAPADGWRDRFQTFYGSRMREGTAALFFAEADGGVVGLAAVYLSATHRTEVFMQRQAYVSSVYVVESMRRRGVASRLMELTVEWARAMGCRVIRLRPSAIGRTLYEKVGFEASDEMEMDL